MMMSQINGTYPSHRIRMRMVALPAEHGSWGLVLEPILLSLLVAPSLSGTLLALAAFAAFLIRHPFNIVLKDWQQQKWLQRTTLAMQWMVFYSMVAFLGGIAAIWMSGSALLCPLALALPFLMLFFMYDVHGIVRSWQAQLAAPVACSAIAASIAIAGGWSFSIAFPLWGVAVARSIPAIIYVRERLRLERDKPYHAMLAIGLHLLGIVLVTSLVLLQVLPGLAILAYVLLLVRAIIGLSRYRRFHSTKAVGISEMVFGIVTVAIVVAGYWI